MPTFLSKIFKISALVFFGLLFLLFLFFALLPTIVSTSVGQRAALHLINHSIEGCIEVKRLSLSWFKGQQIEGFKLSGCEGQEILSFDSFSTEETLLSLLVGRYHLGKTTLCHPVLHYVTFENGDLNLEKALSISSKKKSRKKKRLKTRGEFKGSIEIVGGTITVETPIAKPIVISDIQMNIQDNPSLFHFTGKTEQGGALGEILVSGTLGPHLHLMADIKNFPVALLDEWKGSAIFNAALGPKLDLKGELEKKEESLHLITQIHSVNLKGDIVGKTSNNTFIVDPSSNLVFSLQPALFDELVPAPDWKLANKPKITLKIDELMYLFDKDTFSIQGDLNLERAELTHEKLGNFSLNHFIAKVDTREDVEVCYSGQIQSKGGLTIIEGTVDLDQARNLFFTGNFKGFPTELLEIVFSDAKKLPQLLGNQIDMVFQGTYADKELNSTYELNSSRLNVKGKVSGQEINALTLTMNGQISIPEKLCPYLGDKAELEVTAPLPTLHATLTNPHLNVKVKGELGAVDEPFDYQDVDLEINGSLSRMPILSSREAFSEGTFYIHVDGAKNLILGKADLGNINAPGKPEMHASVQIENFVTENKISFKESRILASGIASDFPTELINLFTGSQIPYAELVGPSLKLQFEGQYTPKQEEHRAKLHLDAIGSGFETNFSVTLNETLHVEQEQPSFIRWDLTPERYQTLTKLFHNEGKSPFVLAQKARVELVIKDLVCPTPPHESISGFLCQSGFIGDFIAEGLKFKDPNSRDHLAFPKITGSIHGEDFSKAIYINLSGNIEALAIPPDQKAGVYFDGQMIDFWTPLGKFNREKLKLKGELRLDLVPVREMLILFPIENETRRSMYALLGALVNGRIYGEISELSGPLTVDIKSSNFKALLPVQLQNGTIFLKQAVETELTLTPEVSEAFLKDINPLFLTGAWSDHPIKLYIDANNFMLPLHPFSLQQVRVETAVIDLGRVRVRNGGDVAQLMTLIKAKDISPEGVMEAWFTPIFVTLNQGVASYRRFDLLLAGNVHLAFWGSIDLVNDRVNMTLGISEQTLNERFNLSGIGKTAMFQLKMGGTTSHLVVDWSSAATRIGILIAKSAGGGLGAIVGGLLEGIINTMGDEPTPPPTTQPLPWQR